MNKADWVNSDFYKTLGVSKDAEQSEIKKAYRKLARDNHPDSNPDNAAAEERFKEVAEAYDVLGDDSKRKEYDEMRAAYASGGFPGGFGFGRGGGSGGQPGAGGFDLNDLFGDLLNRNGGAGFGQRQPRPRKGDNLEADTRISFADAVAGTTITLLLSSDAACVTCSGTGGKPGTRPHMCPTCDGSGTVVNSLGGAFQMNETCPECHGRQLVYADLCATCHGSGRGVSKNTVAARIPAGVSDGQRIRLAGKGAEGDNGGPRGDLLVTVRVSPDKVFGRKGDNLTVKVPVRFDEAVLGGEIKVPTLSGDVVTLRLSEGTANGQTLRVRGKGVPKKSGAGDLLVTVEVKVPEDVDDPIRQAAASYREAVAARDPRAELLSHVLGRE